MSTDSFLRRNSDFVALGVAIAVSVISATSGVNIAAVLAISTVSFVLVQVALNLIGKRKADSEGDQKCPQ
ncbi:hypothetical protein [Mobilicoccus caccae]|uniref:hypothetical protein n=1 Tax=Mobilicoccus caccae TaxID=1859295 RepID=UPI0024E184F2|nr:hypothetical protein [Mobilicoccus caccae]